MNFAIPKMDIIFLFKLRKKYIHVQHHMESIIDEYNSIIQDPQALLGLHMASNIFTDSTQLIHKRNLIQEEFISVKQTVYKLTQQIQSLCKHDFVDDYIDIDCDKSKRITYCKKCEYTK